MLSPARDSRERPGLRGGVLALTGGWLVSRSSQRFWADQPGWALHLPPMAARHASPRRRGPALVGCGPGLEPLEAPVPVAAQPRRRRADAERAPSAVGDLATARRRRRSAPGGYRPREGMSGALRITDNGVPTIASRGRHFMQRCRKDTVDLPCRCTPASPRARHPGARVRARRLNRIPGVPRQGLPPCGPDPAPPRR
jgi:hypothetical protein